jgi:predicted nucleotidyltransferase
MLRRMPVPEQLPEAVKRALSTFTAQAKQVFAEDLVAIVLFGSGAEGRLRETSDVNLIVVLAKVEPTRLQAIGDAYRLAHAAIRLSVMFIREGEIAVASEAFAVKFADVAQRHVVIEGRDPFAGLRVSREAQRQRLHQVLVNLVLRLRERYALAGKYDEQLAWAAADAVGPLRAAAASLLTLESGAKAEPRVALEQVAAAAGKTTALAAMTEARQKGRAPDAGGAAALLGAIDLAAAIEERAQRLER